MTDWPFGDLERGKYGAIYADPPLGLQNMVGTREERWATRSQQQKNKQRKKVAA